MAQDGFCGVDVVKFQKRNPKECLTSDQYASPHPNPSHSFGSTYGEHREALELSIEDHKLLQQHCEEKGVAYCTSVWDVTSAKDVIALEPSLIKVPSACNLHEPMLRVLVDSFPGEIHVSLGMTSRSEEEWIVEYFEHAGRQSDLVLYACTSGYPVPFNDVCLLEITRLKKCYGSRVREIGFSGHHLGISVDVAAMTLGATVIERHFTLDRTQKGTDHAASLEPDGMRRLCRDLTAVNSALRSKGAEVLPIEDEQRVKLKDLRYSPDL